MHTCTLANSARHCSQKNFPNGTVEELMHELLENKRDLAENIIVPFNVLEIQQKIVEQMVS
ncbi:hypothetical protein H1215_02355 [Anoxybacillus sp. LAT_38]|nr:hypothetical protein [Anoxybacillus sp. LAT_26]MCG6196136.1 hypothetical protein [Anoxybacillus sp. LAT_38]